MDQKRRAIILCGGEGSRLWPLSRSNRPKYLSTFNNKNSLLQDTIERLSESLNTKDIIIVTNKDHKYEVIGQLYEKYSKSMPKILVEPSAKNTLPAITLAMRDIMADNPHSIVGIFPSDHHIKDKKKFNAAWNNADELSKKNYFVLLGIQPQRPDIGYGYIRYDSNENNIQNEGHKVISFHEKPNQEIATKYMNKGYLWNSGIFFVSAKKYIETLRLHQKEIYELFFTDNSYDVDTIYDNINNLSIDVGLAEKCTDMMVLRYDLEWTDLGSWNSVYDYVEKDVDNNAISGRTLLDETTNSLIWSKDRLTVTCGIKDLAIIDTNDALLVISKDKIHKMRNLVDRIKQEKFKEIDNKNIEYRPWGLFEILDESMNYKIKRITVYPNQKLSLQMHNQRSEHWIIIKGQATVTNKDNIFTLHQNESTFIEKQSKHRIENNFSENLVFIEVQYGEYFGEDDIVRFDDIYKRES